MSPTMKNVLSRSLNRSRKRRCVIFQGVIVNPTNNHMVFPQVYKRRTYMSAECVCQVLKCVLFCISLSIFTEIHAD